MGEDPKVEMSIKEHGISGCRAFVSWLDFDRPIGDQRCRVIGFGRTPAEATADALTCRGVVPSYIAAIALQSLPDDLRADVERAMHRNDADGGDAQPSTPATSSPPDFFTAVDGLNTPATPAAEPAQSATDDTAAEEAAAEETADTSGAEGPSTDPTAIISATCVCGHPVRISAPTSVRFISCRCQKCGKPVWVRVDTALTADGDGDDDDDDDNDEDAESADADDSDRDSIEQLTREIRHLNSINADLLEVNEIHRAKIATLTAENAELKAAPAPVPTDADRITALEAVIADRDATIASLQAELNVVRAATPAVTADPLSALSVDDVRADLVKTRHRLYCTSRALANSLDVALLSSMSWHRAWFGLCPSSAIVLRAMDEMAELYAATLRREIQADWHNCGVTEAKKFLEGRSAVESQTFADAARRAAIKHLTAFDLNPTSGTQTDITYEMADVLIVLSGVLARLTGGYEYELRLLADNVTRKTAINRTVD